MQRNPQLNEKGELQHLLSIEGLPREIANDPKVVEVYLGADAQALQAQVAARD